MKSNKYYPFFLLVFIIFFSRITLGQSNLNSTINAAPSAYSGNGFANSSNSFTTTTNAPRAVFPAGSTIIPLAPQNIFNDPGTGANITGIPLIWYYMDTFGMSNCEGQSEPTVEYSDYVSISFQPDCANSTKTFDQNLAKSKPIVSYARDLQEHSYYIPLGVVMIQASWDKSDQVNLFTIMKGASNFISKHVNGFDQIILVGDILQRNISSQRAIEGMSQGITVTPSISSTLGADGISGAMFGYGRSNGESHPVSRTGVTLLVVALAPGPWAGRKPLFTQTAYVTNATALPQTIQQKATESLGGIVMHDNSNAKQLNSANKFTVEEAVVVSGSGRH
jgi:hypothetical protein